MANLSRFLITNALLNVRNAITQVLHDRPQNEYDIKTLRNVESALETLVPEILEKKQKPNKKGSVSMW
jgi:hypothetical protein